MSNNGYQPIATSDLINNYVALLILQYSSLANALATVQAQITALIQNQIIDAVRQGFNLQTATGAQLDILASYVGVTRNAFGLLAAAYWSLAPYNAALPGGYLGWSTYNYTTPPTIRWLSYNDVDALLYSLSDGQERKLIQLAAALNSSDMGLGDLDNLLYLYFGTNVNLLDNENMSIVYQHKASDTDPLLLWDIALLENVFPHQAGVAVSFVEV